MPVEAGSRFRGDSAPGLSIVRRTNRAAPGVPVNFDGTADHAIRKIVEFHLRALPVLRGCSLSVRLFSAL